MSIIIITVIAIILVISYFWLDYEASKRRYIIEQNSIQNKLRELTISNYLKIEAKNLVVFPHKIKPYFSAETIDKKLYMVKFNADFTEVEKIVEET